MIEQFIILYTILEHRSLSCNYKNIHDNVTIWNIDELLPLANNSDLSEVLQKHF
jgi:hypothetical protein